MKNAPPLFPSCVSTLPAGTSTSSTREAMNWSCLSSHTRKSGTDRRRSIRGSFGLTARPRSRIDAAGERRLRDAMHRDHVRGRAHVDLVLLRHVENVVERLDHDLLEARVDRRLAPEEVLEVLDPFEIGHRDAAGVAQDVGDEERALVEEDAVRFG